MKMKDYIKYLIVFVATILTLKGVEAQTEDCGRTKLLAAIEDSNYYAARGPIENGTNWKFAKVYNFSQSIDENISIGIQVEGSFNIDTTYICYPDIIEPTAVRYKGTTVLMYPWHFDVFNETLSRDQMAAIPNPVKIENCPDTVYNSFELWYSAEGYARYKRRGAVLEYLNPVDTISDIVEDKIIKKDCLKFKAGKSYVAKSSNEIVIRRGYCTDKNTNNKDVLTIERGELIKYKGVEVDGDIITFKDDKNFKLTFAPGRVKISKADKGGQLQFISNTEWN